MRILKTFNWIIAGLLLLAPLSLAAFEDPQQLVRTTGDRVLAEVSARKAELEANPQLIYPLVQSTVIPHFDFRRMAQAAMGRFWRDADEAQRDQITEQFRELLVRTYATALLGYSGETIEYLPMQQQEGASKVMVPTRIASAGAPPIPINYRLQREDSKWLVYDVVIDGVSLITNYRSQFANEVRRGGVDGLISTLADKKRAAGH